MKFSIGEFSTMTQLTIKSLRLYHEKGILIPEVVDEFSGYRYYSNANYETARIVKLLKEFDFSLAEIKEIIDECGEDEDLVTHLDSKLKEVTRKINRYHEISRSIETIIKSEKENQMNTKQEFVVEEKEIETMLIAGHRMKGKYDECGQGFGIVAKALGRHINGKAMNLYYDHEYKENDADFEACFPVRKGKDSEGISVRELKGGKAVTLIHKGPYDNLGESYKKLFTYIQEKGYQTQIPTREVYLKGPGMIFRGNPQNYLTEIIFMLK